MHQLLCKCTVSSCVNEASRDEDAESKISAPLPSDTRVLEPSTGTAIRGVQFQRTAVAEWTPATPSPWTGHAVADAACPRRGAGGHGGGSD